MSALEVKTSMSLLVLNISKSLVKQKSVNKWNSLKWNAIEKIIFLIFLCVFLDLLNYLLILSMQSTTCPSMLSWCPTTETILKPTFIYRCRTVPVWKTSKGTLWQKSLQESVTELWLTLGHVFVTTGGTEHGGSLRTITHRSLKRGLGAFFHFF